MLCCESVIVGFHQYLLLCFAKCKKPFLTSKTYLLAWRLICQSVMLSQCTPLCPLQFWPHLLWDFFKFQIPKYLTVWNWFYFFWDFCREADGGMFHRGPSVCGVVLLRLHERRSVCLVKVHLLNFYWFIYSADNATADICWKCIKY